MRRSILALVLVAVGAAVVGCGGKDRDDKGNGSDRPAAQRPSREPGCKYMAVDISVRPRGAAVDRAEYSVEFSDNTVDDAHAMKEQLDEWAAVAKNHGRQPVAIIRPDGDTRWHFVLAAAATTADAFNGLLALNVAEGKRAPASRRAAAG